MSSFTRFHAPGMLTELAPQALETWSTMFANHSAQFAFNFDRYFDPTASEAPTAPTQRSIVWSAGPARLLAQFTDRQRWEIADASRDEQDEYCEWRVARDRKGKLTSVTFSTEVPEYWTHIAENDRGLLVELYRQFVNDAVVEDDLFDDDDVYMINNRWNDATSTGIAHLRQASNKLLAAINLAAESTVQRADGLGNRIADRRRLVVCGQLGEPLRNSDPQIADIVNDAVFAGFAVSLANPLGLFLEPLHSAPFRAPDGTDVAVFWRPERGHPGHVVRATFKVPEGAGYVLGDLTVDGRPLEFGSQVADKVPVRIDALLAPSTTPISTLPCIQ
ncbi:MAG: hypothetical protein ABIR39_19185 [Nocardioides sp.]|uniref:hypothetical protein n=1 Tax=Nocardioides sp. TaxID=35761 RepID=UPI0032679953